MQFLKVRPQRFLKMDYVFRHQLLEVLEIYNLSRV